MLNLITLNEMAFFNNYFFLNFPNQFFLNCNFLNFWFLAVTMLNLSYSFFSNSFNFYWNLPCFIDKMFLIQIADFRLDEYMRNFLLNYFVLNFFLDNGNIIRDLDYFCYFVSKILWTFNVSFNFLDFSFDHTNFNRI